MTTWTVVVPVKRFDEAKTRLDADPSVRAALALAFARDAVRAVLATPAVVEVVLVTSEPELAPLASDGRVRLLADPGGGLNAALAAGVAHVVRTQHAGRAGDEIARGAGTGRAGAALLASDLPGLDPADLAAALDAAAGHPLAVVPDAEGTGTTLLTALDPAALVPRFGPGSRAAHEAAGHRVLAAGPSLRLDVDTAADLQVAVRRGVGPATARVLAPHPALCRLNR